MILMMSLRHNCPVVFSREFIFPISFFFLHRFVEFAIYPRIPVFNSPVILVVADKRTSLCYGNNPLLSWRVRVLFITVTASAQVSPLDNCQSHPKTNKNGYHDESSKKTWQQDLQFPIRIQIWKDPMIFHPISSRWSVKNVAMLIFEYMDYILKT